MSLRPKLRGLRVHPVAHNGQQGVLLEDPLGLSGHMIFVPQTLAPALALMDGTRDARGIQAALQLRVGLYIPGHVLEQLIQSLDQALMLENERFQQARDAALRAYREAPYRPPSHAGAVYPDNADALDQALEAYRAQLNPALTPATEAFRAVISPHIDYQRGGPVYAGVWTHAAEAARQAQRVIVLGTDHNGDFGTVTLTRQNYATPYGVLPTDQEVVQALVDAIGEEEAFREELHHRKEHSIELALVWLHHVRRGKPVKVVPILLGSFAHFTSGEADPTEDARLNATVRVLQEVMQDGPTLLVAGADLAHVGPAFGDPRPLDLAAKAQLRAADEQLIQAMLKGDAEQFYQAIAAVRDRYRICGLPPIYVLLRVLNGGAGILTGYDQCPADEQQSSVVSICGVAIA